MNDFGTELPSADNKPLLTLLCESLYEDFADSDSVTNRDIGMWIRGLDASDPTNKQIKDCVRGNPGWIKLLASRVRKHLGIRE